MTTRTISLLILFVISLLRSADAFATSSALAFAPLAFLSTGSRPNRSTTSETKKLDNGNAELSPSEQDKSLAEFNALCQQIIAEERSQHYYPYVESISQFRP